MVREFFYPLLTDADFDAKPLVLLVGSYSTGKTSFIRYLLDQDFPGMHIGPEPTTDGFQAILYGTEECVATWLRARAGHSARPIDSSRPFECSPQEAAARQHSRNATGLSVWRACSIRTKLSRALLRLRGEERLCARVHAHRHSRHPRWPQAVGRPQLLVREGAAVVCATCGHHPADVRRA